MSEIKEKRKRIYPEKLTAQHIPDVAKLEKMCFSSPWSENSLELLTKEGIGMGMVCHSDGVLCAYGGMLCVVDEGQITNIATHPDFRRRGMAEKCIKSTIFRCKDKTLYILPINEYAQKLYEKLGFYQIGRRPKYYRNPREDALILRKEWEL